ncbi:MAG: hypothetical protein ACK53C_19175, partial [Pseudomonadota bacterium]
RRLGPFRLVSRRRAGVSRLRLVIRAPVCSYIHNNLTSATPVHVQQPHEARVARIRVLHDREHPSALLIPVTGP